MTALTKSNKSKASDIRTAKPAAKKAASARARKSVAYRSTISRVAVATVGGFKVFGSPVQPAHRTALQIEAAVAGLN